MNEIIRSAGQWAALSKRGGERHATNEIIGIAVSSHADYLSKLVPWYAELYTQFTVVVPPSHVKPIFGH